MFIIAIILVFLTSIFITSVFKIESLVSRILSIYLISIAQIVLTGELAGTTGFIDNQTFYMILHVLMLMISIRIWIRFKKPKLISLFEIKKILENLGGIKSWLCKYPDLAALGIAILFSFFINALLILVVPPNTNDSMTTHMARIGFWLQNGSFKPWDTPYIFQIIYPFNAQLQILWTVVLSGSDHFAGFIQHAAYLFSGLAIYGLARCFGWGRSASLFSSLVWASFPQILLQSSSTQNDLVVAVFSITGLYFFCTFFQDLKKINLALSALSFGIAAGTKQTWFFLIPGLLLIGILLFNKYKLPMRIMLNWGLLTAILTLVFGSYIYIQNWVIYKNPFGPSEVVASDTMTSSLTANIIKVTYNPARHFYQFLDPSGLSARVSEKVMTFKAAILMPFFDKINLPLDSRNGLYLEKNPFTYYSQPGIQEDTSWFGPLSVLVLLPAFVFQSIEGIKKKDPKLLGLIAIGASYFFLVSLLRRGWSLYQGRYFVLSITILAPLMASLFSKRVIGRFFRIFVTLIGVGTIFTTITTNPAKPIIPDPEKFHQTLTISFREFGVPGVINHLRQLFADKNSIFQLDRTKKITLQGGYMRIPLSLFDKYVSPGETLGLLAPEGTWHYPFFGENLDTYLIPIFPIERIMDAKWLDDQDLDWLLIADEMNIDQDILDRFTLIEHYKNWEIYRP